VFTKKRVPYEYFSTRRFQIYDKKFGISFDSERIWEEFDWLLQFRCPICDAKRKEVFFDTFMQMRQHVRKDHERFFCDLCVENLKVRQSIAGKSMKLGSSDSSMDYSPSPAEILTILNPVTFLSRPVHFWVDLKAGK
jgi:hypothetical protein